MPGSRKRPGCDPQMDTVYVGVSVSKDGDEGIVGVHGPTGWTPMCFGNVQLIERYKSTLAALARESGEEIRIIKYTRGETIFEAKPK